MSLTNYPNGFPYGVSIRGIPLLSMYSGKVLWVDSVLGSNNYDGTQEYPKASIAYVFDNSLVTAGDIVMCKPGHVETVIAAAGLDLDVAGVCIVFLGQGTNKAYITFTTAVTADMDIDAANITLINPKFVAGIDALTGPIDVNAAHFTIINGEWYDGTSIDTTDCIVGDANADNCVIDGWKYFKGNEGGTAKESNIQFGAASEVQLKNIKISGAFNEGNVEFTAAGLDVHLEDIYLKNTDADPSPAMVLHANTTGYAKNVKMRIVSGTTYVSSVALVNWANDCEGFNADGGTGEPIGTILASSVEGKIDVIDGYFDVPTADAVTDTTIRDVVGRKTDAAVVVVAADKSVMAYTKGLLNRSVQRKKVASVALVAANLTGTVTRFTITGGPIRVLTLGAWVSTVLPAGANTLQFGYTPAGGGGANTLSGATDTASAAADALFLLDGVKATGPVKTTDAGVLAGGQLLISTPVQGVLLAPGVITTIFSAGPPATGAMTVFMEYEPMTALALVA